MQKVTFRVKDNFFFPQKRHTQEERKSKVVQVDHVEEQYVIKRNTFSGKNPLYIEDTERPVFVNNYYVGDNPQQMFHEIRGNPCGIQIIAYNKHRVRT